MSLTIAAYDRLKQTLGAGMFFPNGGLEFAVAGMPNSVAREPYVHKVIDGYVLQSNVNGWHTEGNKVMVRGEGGKKTVPLDPKSVQHDGEGYVAQKLKNAGLRAPSSTIKKIARELGRLKGQ